jgi:hypothetical protein
MPSRSLELDRASGHPTISNDQRVGYIEPISCTGRPGVNHATLAGSSTVKIARETSGCGLPRFDTSRRHIPRRPRTDPLNRSLHRIAQRCLQTIDTTIISKHSMPNNSRFVPTRTGCVCRTSRRTARLGITARLSWPSNHAATRLRLSMRIARRSPPLRGRRRWGTAPKQSP